MKNIFKFLGIAVLACGMMVSCGKDDPEEGTDTTPVNPQPQPQQNVIAVTWGGEAQTIGVTDAYMYSSTNTTYILNAAKGLQNDSYEFPIYRWGLDLDTNPEYGCALTAQYTYGQYGNGNGLWPTDVVETSYYQSQNSQNMGIVGDWQLNRYTTQEDYQMPAAEFDATTRTLSCAITVEMFSYTDLYDYIMGLADPNNATEEDYMTGITNAEKKRLELSLTNYVFDAPSQK